MTDSRKKDEPSWTLKKLDALLETLLKILTLIASILTILIALAWAALSYADDKNRIGTYILNKEQESIGEPPKGRISPI